MKHWFPKEVVKHKREKIAEIIRELASKQNPEKKFHFPTLEFVGVGSGYTDDEDFDANNAEGGDGTVTEQATMPAADSQPCLAMLTSTWTDQAY